MPSTPLICSSIGVATVSAMTFGLAPGYCARTRTVGGATSGYSEIGSAGTDSSPARKISMDRTPAKIGRSIKNLEKFMASSHRDYEFAGRSRPLALDTGRAHAVFLAVRRDRF